MPSKFEPATGNPRLNGVVVEVDEKTGRATSVTRLSYSEQQLVTLATTATAGESRR
jgi:calcineurin-like phosphoesterase